MKYAKILGLMAVAVAALMAFAASASATTLTSGGTTYTSTISSTAEEPVSLDGPFTTVTCKSSTVSGSVESHGTGVTAGGKVGTLTFGECNFTTTVEANGSLEIHPVKVNGTTVEACTGTNCTGTLTSTGAKVLIATSIGNCGYETSSTDIGLVTPSSDTGATATLDIGANGTGKIPRTFGSAGFLCGSTGQWTGAYKTNTPDNLNIDS